jgi:hypothetical protein
VVHDTFDSVRLDVDTESSEVVVEDARNIEE